MAKSNLFNEFQSLDNDANFSEKYAKLPINKKIQYDFYLSITKNEKRSLECIDHQSLGEINILFKIHGLKEKGLENASIIKGGLYGQLFN